MCACDPNSEGFPEDGAQNTNQGTSLGRDYVHSRDFQGDILVPS